MRLHLFSDLHLEFGRIKFPDEVTTGSLAEIVLLAGNISIEHQIVAWAARTFNQPVAIVGGNYESYRGNVVSAIAEYQREAEEATENRKTPVRYLERQMWQLEGRDGTPVRILAATLWTDFELFGSENRVKAMTHALHYGNEYCYRKLWKAVIGENPGLLPTDTSFIHRRTVEFLEAELKVPFDGVTIVLTHHAPSPMSLPKTDRGQLQAATYASALDDFIEEYQPHFWAHGHGRISVDYHIGRTRIVSNPMGYAPAHFNPLFDPAFVIAI